jgi:hypothetical protein
MRTLFYFFFLIFLVACNQSSQNNQAAADQVFDQKKEEAAILAVIEQENTCYWKSDLEGWKKTWSRKNAKSLLFWDGKLYEKQSWKEIEQGALDDFKYFEQSKGSTLLSKVERTNFWYYFPAPHVAVVTFDGYNTDPAGKCLYSKEVKIMEKQEGLWRIVLMDATYDPSKPCRE